MDNILFAGLPFLGFITMGPSVMMMGGGLRLMYAGEITYVGSIVTIATGIIGTFFGCTSLTMRLMALGLGMQFGPILVIGLVGYFSQFFY